MEGRPDFAAVIVCSCSLLFLADAAAGPPTITGIANQAINVNSSTGPLDFAVGDVETPPDDLTLSKGSSNPTLVPTNNIVFGGSGPNRTVTVTPATNQTGTATIALTVSDGTSDASTSFLLMVATSNASPGNLTAEAISQTQINLTWTPPTETPGVGGYAIERCQGSSCNGFVQIASLSVTGSLGPLVVSAQNPRYFAAPSGKAVLLGGSHTWINFIDSGTVYPPPAFDYDAWLDFMSTNHHNFFRLWAQGLPKKNYSLQNAGPWYQSPQAWLRTGPGNATDGLPKFDLTQFNQAYFDRLRLRVEKAKARGMYVAIMLFDGYHIQFDRRSDDGYPLTGANNINGVDDGGGTRSQDLSVIPAAVLAAEENYVRKVIDTVNDLPNVLYEIANEAGGYSTTWHQHFITFIKNYQAGKPFQHPVGFTYQYSGGLNSTLYASDADWVSPGDTEPANDGTHHVVLNDTDHSYFWVGLKADGPQANRAFVWNNFTAGNSALFMDPYLMPWTTTGGNVRNTPGGCVSGPSCTVVDPFWNPIRKNIGYMLDYANGKLDLAKMTPQPNLASIGRCLANTASTGAEYLVYASSGGTFNMNLSATTRPLAVEWLNPVTGEITSGGTITGGSSFHIFTTPFSGEAVLYLADTAGHVSQTTYNDTGLSQNTTYRYRVRALDTEGNFSPYSAVASATTQPTNAPSTPPSFTNATAITIPVQGAATPYPSTITVAGLFGTISNVTVTLRGLGHSWGEDIDVLLVGPGGQKVTLMSDAGTGGINNANLTFADAAAGTLPQTGSLVSGTYKPTDYAPADTYPSPAPAGFYATTLSSFNGQSANGVWSLYVYDDGNGDQGSFVGGWSLTITNTAPKELTVTGITADNKVYDGTNTATIHTNGAALVGVIGGDSVTLVLAGATGSFDDKNVGNGKTVQVNGLTIAGADTYKYTLTQPTTNANIAAASQTVTALNSNKVYGSNLALVGTAFTHSGTLYSADTLTNVTLTSAGTTAAAAVGNYAIVPSAAQGVGVGNYAIGYSNGTLTVTAHGLSVVANDATRVIGQTNPVFSGTINGVQNGDNIMASYSSAATTNSPTGTYAIVPALNDPNGKLVNYAAGVTNGILTIVDAPLILSISESPQGTFVIECQVLEGRTYQFQYKNQLSETNWTPLGADQTAVSSRGAITNNAAANLQRFYRLLDVTVP